MRQSSFLTVAVLLLVVAVPASGQQTDSIAFRDALAATRDASIGASESPAASIAAPESPAQLEQREWTGYGLEWAKWSRMTGDWGRLRTDLEQRGLSLDIATVSDVSALATRSSRVQGLGRQLTTVGLSFDLEELAGVPGSRVLVQYQHMNGANGTSVAGDSQGFSNIDADPFSRFGEVWFEQQVGAKARVKTGLIDANTEFAFVDNGADFINSSMGFSPTIFPLPTYPDPHLGLVVHLDPTERTYVAAGVFNGGPAMSVADFRAIFALGEVGLGWQGAGGGRIGIGYWHVGGQRADADEALQPVSTFGRYLVVDQTLWADQESDGARSVGVFFQAGLAEPQLCATSSHLGGGVVARGLVAGRADDALGVGLTAVGMASSTSADSGGSRELALDAFYRLSLTKWVALKPDVQLIKSPGGDPTRRLLVAGTVRVEMGF